MPFLKITGAIMLIASGVSAAALLNGRISKNLSQLEALLSFLRYVKSQIECFGLPVGEIISRCDREALRACGYLPEKKPDGLYGLFTECDIENTEAKKILLDFCAEFGKSYREEQIKRCDYYISLLEEIQSREIAELPTRKRLNSTLCISGALALIILLI